MSRKKLRLELLDDGTTVTAVVTREETVGGVEIGPIPVLEKAWLSFPAPDTEQWQRDLVVQVLEYL